jgi:hypothetical protein
MSQTVNVEIDVGGQTCVLVEAIGDQSGLSFKLL